MTVVRENPPGAVVRENPPLRGNRSRLSDALFDAATTPGEWCRLETYAPGARRPEDTAATMASALRHGRRATRRPAGTWEFRSGPVDPKSKGFNPAKPFGVWGRFFPPTSTPTGDTP